VALAAFRGSLAFTPERTPSLEGLVAAARAVGRTTVAQDAQARLDHIRRGSH
jgi:hypothetical protein